MIKVSKGQWGYIKARKKQYLAFAGIEFAAVLSFLALGYVLNGTKLNLLTAVAVLGCLPAAKMLVEFITIAPYQTIEERKYKDVEEKATLLTKVYDLVLTSQSSIMAVDVVVISNQLVCGYTSRKKTDEQATADYIKQMLRQNHIDDITVKIFCDYTSFLSRADGLNRIVAIEQPDTKQKEQEIRTVILTLSM